MGQLVLEVTQVPAGIAVTGPREGRLIDCAPGNELFIGRDASSCDVLVAARADAPDAMGELCEGGWGGRRNSRLWVTPEGRWFVEDLGHSGNTLLNGEPLRFLGHRELLPGDRLQPSKALVFTLIDLHAGTSLEPAALLDAVADEPADAGRWHVLADWLIEHQAPHALLAAYELRLEAGTNDPELLGEYVEARRARHRLPTDLHLDHLQWRCGYVVSCSLWLGPRDSGELERLRGAFQAPQLAALSRLTLQCNGTESGARLQGVISVIPKSVRHLALQFNAPAPFAALIALLPRPGQAHTISLHLAEPVGHVPALLETLVARGWKTIDLSATRLTQHADQVAPLIERNPHVRFMLGGTFLSAEQARGLLLPNVDWVPTPDSALAVDLETGAALPLGRMPPGFGWGLSLRLLGSGWLTDDQRLLGSGDRFRAGGRSFQFLCGPSLNERYRALVRAWPTLTAP